MIAGASFSVVSALRAAEGAREAADRMARQIATGQRVSSVTDDGAAWTRAAAIASTRVGEEARLSMTTILRTAVSETQAFTEGLAAMADQIAEIVLRARAHEAGSQQRQILQAELVSVVTAFSQARHESSVLTSGYGFQPGTGKWLGSGKWGIATPGGDPMLAGTSVLASGQRTNLYDTWMTTAWPDGTVFATLDLSTADDSYMKSVSADAAALQARFREIQLQAAGELSWLETVDAHTVRTIDRLDVAAGALTDADLQAASTAQARAEARQQLALATVRQALDTYRAFASGLLGNVQRSMRSVLA
jgi:hypothetical protein